MNLASIRELLFHTGKNKWFIIPFFFTFANALCGFLAVIKTLDEDFIIAAACIILAAFMDLCDGRLARMFNAVSVLGMELDSLCDAISFCFAPAILMYSWSLYSLGIPGMVVLGLYLCCGLFRLARFNTTAPTQTNTFIGLPTTLAAFFLANLVLYQDWLLHSSFKSILRADKIAFIVCIISLLMVSTIRFPSTKTLNIRFVTGSLFFLVALFALWLLCKGYPLFLFAVTVYIVAVFLMGIFREILRLFRARRA